MKVVCKENIKCDFVKTCKHSRPHEYDKDCSWKDGHCCENCMCSEENVPIYESYVTIYERKAKLKKLNGLHI